MSLLIHEIVWSPPILPRVRVPEWEAEVQDELGRVPDSLTRVSRSPWIRQTVFKWPRYKTRYLARRYRDICDIVSAQENACRYCYGYVKAQMRFLGYSERMIRSIEEDVLGAELDDKDRVLVQFCRNLSRSRPRPPKDDLEKLKAVGFRHLEVAELVFLTINNCFMNRVSTFISVPPMDYMEKLSVSFKGKLLRPLIARKIRKLLWQDDILEGDLSHYPVFVRVLAGLPAAKSFHDAFQGAIESRVLSRELKVLMFAVVARTLRCPYCETETLQMALNLGFTEQEFDESLHALRSDRLNDKEQRLLTWTRETIHFQTGPVQESVKNLVKQIDEVMLLEAIGVASLANAAVRLAVLIK